MKRPLLSMINIRNVVSSFHLIAMILVPFLSTFAADDYVADYSYMRGKIEVQEFGRLHRSSSIVMRADPHGLLESPPNITPLDVTFWVRKDPEKGISTILTYQTYDEYLGRLCIGQKKGNLLVLLGLATAYGRKQSFKGKTAPDTVYS